MTIDIKKLKALAEAATGLSDVSLAPDVVLELIAENERLERKNANQSESIREYQDLVIGGDVSLGMLKADIRVTTGERDELKAECEGLRAALTNVREAVQREYWDEYAGLDDTRAILDAALSKEASNG